MEFFITFIKALVVFGVSYFLERIISPYALGKKYKPWPCTWSYRGLCVVHGLILLISGGAALLVWFFVAGLISALIIQLLGGGERLTVIVFLLVFGAPIVCLGVYNMGDPDPRNYGNGDKGPP